jgi:hypothetical protein
MACKGEGTLAVPNGLQWLHARLLARLLTCTAAPLNNPAKMQMPH